MIRALAGMIVYSMSVYKGYNGGNIIVEVCM